MIIYLLFWKLTVTFENRLESFNILIISLLYSSSKFFGISFNRETITSVSVNLFPLISNKLSLEYENFE